MLTRTRVPVLSRPNLLRGLTAHYPLSDTLDDSGGSGLTLTNNNGVTFIAGKVGNAANLVAASNQCLSVADNPALSMGAGVQWTISVWVYAVSYPNATNPIVTKGDTSEYYLDVTSLGILRLYANSTAMIDAGAITAGQWHHILVWYDGVNYRISVDNGTPALGGVGDTVASSGLFMIGSRSVDPTLCWNGLIDEVAVWKYRILTDNERAYFYNSGFGRTYPF